MSNTNRFYPAILFSLLILITLLTLLTLPRVVSAQTGVDEACPDLQSCIDKYQQLIPQWQEKIKEFSTIIRDQLPELENDVKDFGQKSEQQLQEWLREWESQLPPPRREPAPPKTIWL